MIPSKADRRAAARGALLAAPDRSDRLLSAETGLCRELIGRVRADLTRSGELPACPTRGRDGKTYRPRPRKARPRDARVPSLLQRINGVIRDMQSPAFVEAWYSTPQSTRRRLAADAFRLNTEAARLRRLA